MIRWLVFKLAEYWLLAKWYFLDDYYSRLIVQARYLYRKSPLFRYRWQELGLEFAEEAFRDDAMYFFNKAREENILIRLRIFADFILHRPAKPYYMADED